MPSQTTFIILTFVQKRATLDSFKVYNLYLNFMILFTAQSA